MAASKKPPVNRDGSQQSDALDLPYEESLAQLEEILDRLNGSVSLADSVAMFERADRLLNHCSQQLRDAESKIETLIKNRSGDIVQGPDGRPKIQAVDLASSSEGEQSPTTI